MVDFTLPRLELDKVSKLMIVKLNPYAYSVKVLANCDWYTNGTVWITGDDVPEIRLVI